MSEDLEVTQADIWGRAFQAKGLVSAKGESTLTLGRLRDKRQVRVSGEQQVVKAGEVHRVGWYSFSQALAYEN